MYFWPWFQCTYYCHEIMKLYQLPRLWLPRSWVILKKVTTDNINTVQRNELNVHFSLRHFWRFITVPNCFMIRTFDCVFIFTATTSLGSSAPATEKCAEASRNSTSMRLYTYSYTIRTIACSPYPYNNMTVIKITIHFSPCREIDDVESQCMRWGKFI